MDMLVAKLGRFPDLKGFPPKVGGGVERRGRNLSETPNWRGFKILKLTHIGAGVEVSSYAGCVKSFQIISHTINGFLSAPQLAIAIHARSYLG